MVSTDNHNANENIRNIVANMNIAQNTIDL
jgi:hypothetical protein